tara:strand:- start:2653 stop:3174 length:522 start_codon:yes stop_codon:yes gene_type:complete
MPKIILYIAASEDGYIADTEGGVGWLDKYNDSGEDCGYADFFTSIDALIIGRKTYGQILGFGAWPYEAKPCYVFSRDCIPLPKDAGASVHLVSDALAAWLAEQPEDKRYWLVGGAELAQAFLNLSAIDEVILTTLPEKLGSGIMLPTAIWSAIQGIAPGQKYPNGILQYTFSL